LLIRVSREQREPVHYRRSYVLTLSRSRQIIDAAISRALHLGINISVAVSDKRGRLIALNQMDGSNAWETDRCSMGKAVAAAISGLPSDQFFEYVHAHGSRLTSWNNVVSPRGQRGGLPIIEAGVVLGGCGVSGAAVAEQDEECARAGIAALEPSLTVSLPPSYAGRTASRLSMASSA
jgi:uncharacterized protein GlcG (DUF336 family)